MKGDDSTFRRGQLAGYGLCWRAVDAEGNEGFLCHKQKGLGGWSRSARGRDPAPYIPYFINKATSEQIEFVDMVEALLTIDLVEW